MKTRKVISTKNLAMRSPLLATIVFWLALDHWQAPGWAWGAVGLLMVVIWIAWIIDVWNVEQVEVIK